MAQMVKHEGSFIDVYFIHCELNFTQLCSYSINM